MGEWGPGLGLQFNRHLGTVLPCPGVGNVKRKVDKFLPKKLKLYL